MQARGGEPGSSGGGGQPASAGSEAPSQGLPQGRRDSLALGRVCCPHAGKGALTQPSQAHRAAVPGSLPVAWERRWVPGAGCSVPARQERWDTFPRSTADRPGQPAVHGPLLRLPPPPAPGQAPAPSSPKPWPGAQLGPGCFLFFLQSGLPSRQVPLDSITLPAFCLQLLPFPARSCSKRL